METAPSGEKDLLLIEQPRVCEKEMSLGYIINLTFYVFVVYGLWVSSGTNVSNAILSEDWEETHPKFKTKLDHFLYYHFLETNLIM